MRFFFNFIIYFTMFPLQFFFWNILVMGFVIFTQSWVNAQITLEITLFVFVFFNFSHVRRKMIQKTKFSKNQLSTPTNHPINIFCALAFSAHSASLNVQFWTYFKIRSKNWRLFEFYHNHREVTKNIIFPV